MEPWMKINGTPMEKFIFGFDAGQLRVIGL